MKSVTKYYIFRFFYHIISNKLIIFYLYNLNFINYIIHDVTSSTIGQISVQPKN